MLETRHLKTLLALAQSESISVAARRLHLTQSALSHQIRFMETHYGVSLFERNSRPLRLSKAGQRLLQLAQQVTDLITFAERDLKNITGRQTQSLRIAVECHTCFDWLMPSMDAFRESWPDIEMDLVSGFHSDPLALLEEQRADFVIVSEPQRRTGISYQPLFRFEILALVANNHPLNAKTILKAKDFENEVLITYPVPEEMIDVIRQFLRPAGVHPQRRTTELTVAILQLVASRRGIAALPGWSVHTYIDRQYIAAKRIGRSGLWSNLYAAIHKNGTEFAYMTEFLKTVQKTSFSTLPKIVPIK